MQKNKTNLISVIFLILSFGFAFATPDRINTGQYRLSPVDKIYTEDSINCLILKAFFKEHFPDLDIHGEISKLSGTDKIIMEEDYDIFFRFLSLLSGRNTPFNIEYGTYSVKNPSWIRLPENVYLAEWYECHQDEIKCEIFNEYYQLVKGMRKGPKIRIDDFEEYSIVTEAYFDSIYDKMTEFEHKYYKWLEKDSIDN